MLHFVFRHYKAMLAIITVLVVPMVMASWGFLITTSNTNAMVPNIEKRVVGLEQLSYRLDERYRIIQESLNKIEQAQSRQK